MTWVHGNHTYKLGATALFEGIQSLNSSRADGQFAFAQQQTADPWQNGQPFANVASSGFGYASFFLGDANTVSTAAPADVRLRYPFLWNLHSGQLEDHAETDLRLRPALGLRDSVERAVWPYAECRLHPAQHTDRRTAWNRGVPGYVRLQLRQRLPVCIRTAPGSGLPDHAEDGVPRGRRYFLRGGFRSSRA